MALNEKVLHSFDLFKYFYYKHSYNIVNSVIINYKRNIFYNYFYDFFNEQKLLIINYYIYYILCNIFWYFLIWFIFSSLSILQYCLSFLFYFKFSSITILIISKTLHPFSSKLMKIFKWSLLSLSESWFVSISNCHSQQKTYAIYNFKK